MKINTQIEIYNGYNTRQLIEKLNYIKMHKTHKKIYLKNCIEVYNNEKTKTNLNMSENLRNSNFNLTMFYKKLNNI